ncbi:glyoxalase superfamily protein [Pseudomonas sp. MDT1-17]
MQTIETMKADAKRLRSFFNSIDIPITASQSLEAVAVQRQFKNWNTAVAMSGKDNNFPEWPPAAVENLTRLGLNTINSLWAATTVCVTADMTPDTVRAEVEDCLRNEPKSIRLRLDAAASGTQLREARMIAAEVESRGVHVEVDCPL